jgi:hypothetical protein
MSNEDVDIVNGSENFIIYSYGTDIDLYNLNVNLKDVRTKNVQLIDKKSKIASCETKTDVKAELKFQPTSNYDNYLDLVENGVYRLYWN